MVAADEAKRFQLYHRLPDPDSARVRELVGIFELTDRADFCNIHFESHAKELADHGGKDVPAIWDGEELHVGVADCTVFLSSCASGE